MATTRRARGFPPELAVCALVGAAALPLTRLFERGGLGLVVIWSLTLSVAVSWGTRRLRLPPFAGLLVSALALGWAMALAFFPETLWAVFPSSRTIAAFQAAAREGIRISIEEAAPVAATTPVLIFVAAGVWVTAWLVDAAVSLGNPLLAIASGVPLFVVPGSLVLSARLSVEVALFGIAAAWVLFSHERARAQQLAPAGPPVRAWWRIGTGARLFAVALAIALMIVPRLPGFGDEPGLRARGPGNRIGFNPLVAIKPTLNHRNDAVLFTVRTSAPGYYRLTSLPRFDGAKWMQGEEPERSSVDLLAGPSGPSGPNGPTRVVRQEISILALAGPWLPAEYDPYSVSGVPEAEFEQDSRALILSDGLRRGLNYSVISRIPDVTAEDLDFPAAYGDRSLAQYLQVPRGLPKRIESLARESVGTRATPFQRAVALQDYLRRFTYDENVAAGHSYDTILGFLRARRGYCEQFAATMAVMARVLGIPARVAIGFAPGRRTPDGAYSVTTRSAHAWVEVFFPGFGWISFEPTPRAGVTTVPSYAVSPRAQSDAERPGVAGSAPTPTPSVSADPGRLRDGDAGAARSGTPAATALLVLMVVAVLLGSSAIFLAARRARRRARLRLMPHRERNGFVYRDFLAWCRGGGLARAPGETPAEHAQRLAGRAPAAGRAMRALADVAAEALWGPPDAQLVPVDEAVAETKAALLPTLSRRRRLGAALRWGVWRTKEPSRASSLAEVRD